MASMELFSTPSRTYFKYGSLSLAIRELFEDYHARRFQIVTDDNIVEAGLVNQVLNVLKGTGVHYNVFQKVPEHPTVQTVNNLVESIKSFVPDVIIGIGGGRVISVAKAARSCYEHNTTMEDIFARNEKKKFSEPLFPEDAKNNDKTILVGIETTAGTGASTTHASVIRNDKGDDITIYAPKDMQCDMAIVDVALHMTCPAQLTKVSAFAALAHAIDIYTEPKASDYIIPFAVSSIRHLLEDLPLLLNKLQDVHLRESIANASTMGGFVFSNCGTPGALHYLCSAACSVGMSYGEAAACFIGPVLEATANAHPEVEERIKASLLFMRINSVNDLIEKIETIWGDEYPVVPEKAVQILEEIYPTSFDLSIKKEDLIKIMKSRC